MVSFFPAAGFRNVIGGRLIWKKLKVLNVRNVGEKWSIKKPKRVRVFMAAPVGPSVILLPGENRQNSLFP
jgi:hypothetical protein